MVSSLHFCGDEMPRWGHQNLSVLEELSCKSKGDNEKRYSRGSVAKEEIIPLQVCNSEDISRSFFVRRL